MPLGLDFLTFLAATVLVIPTFKSAKISPVLGFLFSGLLLGQLGCGPLPVPLAGRHLLACKHVADWCLTVTGHLLVALYG